MYHAPDGEFYESEEKYQDSLKLEDSYHFSIPFEYIETNYGNDNYDFATATMEVDFTWSDWEHGYTLSYYSPDAAMIDPSQGNGSIEDFYEYGVRDKALELMDDEGIPVMAITASSL